MGIGAGGITPTGSLTGTQNVGSTDATPVGQQNQKQYQSSLNQSEIEVIASLLMAGMPTLQTPAVNFTNIKDFNGALSKTGAEAIYANVAQNMQQTQNDIINYMWDKYKQTLDEIDERRKEAQKKEVTTDSNLQKPMSPSAYLVYLISVAPHERAVETDPSHTGNTNAIASSGLSLQFNQTFNQWLIHPVAQADNATAAQNANFPSLSFVTGTIASSPDALRASIGTVDSSGISPHMSTSPVADALYFVGPASGLPADYQAAAALVASLINSGSVLKATAETIKDASQKAQLPLTTDFAMNYAKNILSIITHSTEEGQSLADDKSGQNNLIRLLLTTMAVTMLYRAVYGGTSPEEFEGLVNGEQIKGLNPEATTLFNNLIAQLNKFLPPPDSPERTTFLAQLKGYVKSKDPVESMLATTEIFKSMLETGSTDTNRLASITG